MASNLRLYRRVVIVQIRSGSILDIDGAHVRADLGRSHDDQTQLMGDGSVWRQTQTNGVTVPLLDGQYTTLAGAMVRQGCDCIAIALGGPRSKHLGFFEYTKFHRVPGTAQSGEIAPDLFRLQTGVRYPDISDSNDLLQSVPWEGTMTETGSLNDTGLTYDLLPNHPWGGRAWGTDQAAVSPDITGAAPNVTQTDFARTRFPFPAWGATIRVDFPEQQSGDGIIRAKDWDGNTLDTSSLGSSFTLPAKTWWLEIKLTDVPAYPQLFVEDAGNPWGVLEGEITSDCQTRASSPHWNETAINLLAEDT